MLCQQPERPQFCRRVQREKSRMATQISGRYRLFKALPSFVQLTKVEADDGGPDPPAGSLGYGKVWVLVVR